MIADGVSLCIDSPDDVRVFFCIFSYDKKRSNNAGMFQNIEYLWSDTRIWTIIEREGYFFILYVPIAIDHIRQRKPSDILTGDDRS